MFFSLFHCFIVCFVFLCVCLASFALLFLIIALTINCCLVVCHYLCCSSSFLVAYHHHCCLVVPYCLSCCHCPCWWLSLLLFIVILLFVIIVDSHHHLVVCHYHIAWAKINIAFACHSIVIHRLLITCLISPLFMVMVFPSCLQRVSCVVGTLWRLQQKQPSHFKVVSFFSFWFFFGFVLLLLYGFFMACKGLFIHLI